MMNPYMSLGMMSPFGMSNYMFNPYMMRFNMFQSLIGNMLNGSRGCNCNHNNLVQYRQPVIQQPVQPVNYSNVQPTFDNSHFENYMSAMNRTYENKAADIFKQSYEQSFKMHSSGGYLSNIDIKGKENIFENKSSVPNTDAAEEKSVDATEEKSDKKIKSPRKTKTSKKVIQIQNKQIASIVHNKAEKYGVDENLILAMIAQESGFQNGLTSSKGAKGLMQLMPDTARELGVTDVNDPEQNIDAGVRYMKKLLNMYGGDVKKALAAYNGGMGNVNDILNGTNKCKNNPNHIKDPSGIPRMKETQDYVAKIYKNYKNGTIS